MLIKIVFVTPFYTKCNKIEKCILVFLMRVSLYCVSSAPKM